MRCPSIASLHRRTPSGDLPRKLLQLLLGHKLAILGDSMSRQLFSTLVGLLRGQEQILDASTWHPARYVLATEAQGRCIHDDLNLFWQPDATLAETSPPFMRRHNATRLLRGESERAASTTVVADWIMLPRFEPSWAVANGLRLLRASHATRPYTLILFFVPAAWHTRDTADKLISFNQSTWPIPTAFWSALRDESNRMAVNGTRFGAITMPTEHITCSKDDAWRAKVHDDCALQTRCGRHNPGTKWAQYLDMSPTGGARGNRSMSAAEAGVRSCLAHSCCRRSMVAYRNEFVGLPDGWTRLDFAAIANATQPPSLGWHYECQLSPPHASGEAGIRECAEQAMRLKFDACNARYAKWFLGATTMPMVVRQSQHGHQPAWVGRECREVGNTAFWSYITREHRDLLQRAGL